MNTKIKFFAALVVVFALLLVTCKKDKDEFSADDAKVEIKSAGQEIQTNLNLMLVEPPMQSMMFLMQLLELEDEWTSSLKSAAQKVESYNLSSFNKLIREHMQLKNDGIDPEDGGVYTFNFEYDEFELTNPNVNYLMFIFPADELAYANEQNNAELKLDNITIIEVEITDDWGTYYEDVLTSIDASFKIDGQEVMFCDYLAQLNEDALPVSASFNMTMPPYQMTLTHGGSGVNYTSNAEMKHNNDVLLKYNLVLNYTAQQDNIEKATGNFEINPIRFEGEMNPKALDNCDETDIECMNNNIDVEVIQASQNKIIGHIEFRLFYDEYWDEEYAEPVIVYSDGSWEWLFIALGFEFEDFKRGIMKK
jgi:hypothetical protein